MDHLAHLHRGKIMHKFSGPTKTATRPTTTKSCLRSPAQRKGHGQLLLHLQQTVGNHAVQRLIKQRSHSLLHAPQPSPFGLAEEPIQRQETSFPKEAENALEQENQVQRKKAKVSTDRQHTSPDRIDRSAYHGGKALGTGTIRYRPALMSKRGGLNKMIQMRGGATVGHLSVNTNVINAGLIAGHAWLAYTPRGGTKTTYGTWGNRRPIGLHRNLELGYTPAATRTTAIDATDHTALSGFISTNTGWGYLNNCASFAARGWHSVTREALSYTNSIGIPNPSSLGAGIVAANGGATGTLAHGATGTGPSSSGGSSQGSSVGSSGGSSTGSSGPTSGSSI